ncbi:MAG: hypothetical protein QM780_08540 [Hyphomicrobium sp.]|uniref:hypothetical protein n=1 Tax=Hyphomicrobium sp. TaxID=82 RepID=UPI0039E6036E
MAKTQIAFGYVLNNQSATSAPAMLKTPVNCQDITPSATSTATTKTADGTQFNANHQPCCRVATDTQIYVSFGSAPNASTDTERFLIPAGAVEYFYVKDGDKAAVVTA